MKTKIKEIFDKYLNWIDEEDSEELFDPISYRKDMLRSLYEEIIELLNFYNITK